MSGAKMIEAFKQSLQPGRAEFLDASEQEIACFVGDILKQTAILMELTAIPHDRKAGIRQAIEAVEAFLEQRYPATLVDAEKCDWQH